MVSEERIDKYQVTDTEVVDDNEDSSSKEKLTVSQKHNILFPKLQRLSNLICSYFGTEAFLQYVNEFDHIEQLVRRGQKIFSNNKSNEIIDEVIPQESNVVINDDLEKTNHEMDPDIVETSNEDDHGYKLQFLDIVKSQGRPRGSGSGKTDFKIWSKQKSKQSRNLSKKTK